MKIIKYHNYFMLGLINQSGWKYIIVIDFNCICLKGIKINIENMLGDTLSKLLHILKEFVVIHHLYIFKFISYANVRCFKYKLNAYNVFL